MRVAALPRFVVLYAVTYAAYGVASPFFPAVLEARGLNAEQISVTLGTATAIRLVSAPVAARVGDALRRLRLVLVGSTLLATIVTVGLLPTWGFWRLFALALLQAATLAPVTVLSDALALAHARPADQSGGFEYGWVRGAGSAAFVMGTLAAGQAASAFGLTVAIQLQAALLFAAIVCARLVPDAAQRATRDAWSDHGKGVAALLQCAPFRNLVLVAALVLGSHAMHDTFAVIRWTSAGIGPTTASILWSESVIAEVLVFFVVGPALVSRLTPAGAIALAAAAGVLRWMVMGLPPRLALLALVQPLHGLTFALLHLSAMRLIARLAPKRLEATALAIYGTVGVGAATALLTLVSGGLYARLGGRGFWVMAALCGASLPLVWQLRESEGPDRRERPTAPRAGRPPTS